MHYALCIFTALVLLLSMSTTALAAESGDIKVTYSQPKPEKVTVVDLAWGSMEFNYTDGGSTKVWNPEELKYEIVEGDGEAGWLPMNPGGDTVTVTNHSNTGLLVTVTYTKAAENGVDGAMENGSFLLATAEETDVGEAPKGSAKLVLYNNSVPASWNESGATTIGNVTVKLDHCDAVVSTDAELAAALENGGTIILTDDPYLRVSEIYKDTCFNLNGCFLLADALYIYGCELTLTGDGMYTPTGNLYAYDGSTLNITGGTTVLSDIHVYSDSDVIVADGATVHGTIHLYDGTASISGNEVGVVEVYGGRCVISGGYVAHVAVDDGECIISGGTISELMVSSDERCTVSGGYIAHLYVYGDLDITGGTFYEDPTEYVDTEKYDVTENEDGDWTVTPKNP